MEMDWIFYILSGMAVVAFAIGYFHKKVSLKDALGALTEIRGLCTYAREAMADGRLDAKEREEIIGRLLQVAQRFV